MSIQFVDYQTKAEELLSTLGPIDQDWLLFKGNIQDISVASQSLFKPGKPMWNTACFWKAIGGCFTGIDVVYVEDNDVFLNSKLGRFYDESEYFKPVDLETALTLKNAVLFVKNPAKPFGLTNKAADSFMSAAELNGLKVCTENSLVQEKVMNADLTKEGFDSYVASLGASAITVEGNVYWEVKTSRYVSIAFRLTDEGNLVVLRGLTEHEGRFVYSINGEPKSKYLVYAIVLNYLVTCRQETTMNGRLAYMANVFLDDIHVGTSHELLAIQKQYKLGNLVVSPSKNPRVPQVRKGGKDELEAAAKAFHAMGIVTAMHKAGKYLLVDKGAKAAGFGMNKAGDIVYWLDADKASKKVGGRHLHGVPTAYSMFLCNSGVGIRIDGEVFHFKGNKFVQMRIQSPLAPEGSGNFIYNPEMDDVNSPHHQYFGQTRVYSHDFAGSQFGEAGALLSVVTAKEGDEVNVGDVLIGQKSLIISNGEVKVSEEVKYVPKRSNCPGIIKQVSTRWNDQTSVYSVKVVVEEISHSHAQKYRGIIKGRASAFCQDIEVYDEATGHVYFDPSKKLGPVGDLSAENCVHHLVSDEEGKTKIHLKEMASHAGCPMVFNEDHWENEEAFDNWVVENRKVVTVYRSNIEKNVYSILKSKFGSDADFTFKDDERSIVHRNAQAWVGEVTCIVEVPLTHTFVGSTSLFGEVNSYLGIQYPALYEVLLEGVLKNQAAVSEVYTMAQDVSGSIQDNLIYPFIALDEEFGTVVEFSSNGKFDVQFDLMTAEQAFILLGITAEECQAACPLLITSITIPTKEVDLNTFRSIQKAIMAKGEELLGGQTHHDFSRVALVVPEPLKVSVLRLDALARAASTSSQNIAQNLIRILLHLGGEGMGTSNDTLQRFRTNGGWETVANRLMAMLQGAIRTMAVESNSLMSKAARTENVAFQCRAATTISADCASDQALIHPALAAKLGLEDGDTVLVGRNPMPKLGALKLSIHEMAPVDTLLMNAFSWHSFNEGDADGDSVFFLAITPDGDIVVPSC